MKTEIRKLSWGGSSRYQTTTCTIPKKMMALWEREGHMPTHVQLTQDTDGTITIKPVAWPAEVVVPLVPLAPLPTEDLEDALVDEEPIP